MSSHHFINLILPLLPGSLAASMATSSLGTLGTQHVINHQDWVVPPCCPLVAGSSRSDHTGWAHGGRTVKVKACAHGHVGIAAPKCQAWTSRRLQLIPGQLMQGGQARVWEHMVGSPPSQAPSRDSWWAAPHPRHPAGIHGGQPPIPGTQQGFMAGSPPSQAGMNPPAGIQHCRHLLCQRGEGNAGRRTSVSKGKDGGCWT